MLGGATPALAVTGRRLMTLMVDAKLLRRALAIENVLAPGPLARAVAMSAAASSGVAQGHRAADPAGVRARLSTAVNLLYHVPKAEHEAEEDSRKRLAQEMSRLQSTLEYLLLKGDTRGGAARDRRARAQSRRRARRADRRERRRRRRRRGARGSGARSPMCCRSSTSRARTRRSTSAAPAWPSTRTATRCWARRRPARRRRRRAAAVEDRRRVPDLRPEALQGGGARAGGPAVAVLGRLGDGAGARDVARVPFPADASHRAAGACRRGARRRQPRRAQRPQGDRRARPSGPRIRRDGARGGPDADAPAP